MEGPAEGPGSLLSCMAGLQHLTELEISARVGIDWPPAGPAYSALTASSNLASLGFEDLKIPGGAWPHVFRATRKLLNLTNIYFDLHQEITWGEPAVPSAWGAADVSSLVTCCPNLREIGDKLPLQHGPHVSELHKLTALTFLGVVYGRDNASAFQRSLKGLAAVTQLQELSVFLDSTELTAASLLLLTSLTALTKLEVRAPSTDPSSPSCGYVITTEVSPVTVGC